MDGAAFAVFAHRTLVTPILGALSATIAHRAFAIIGGMMAAFAPVSLGSRPIRAIGGILSFSVPNDNPVIAVRFNILTSTVQIRQHHAVCWQHGQSVSP